MPGCDCEPAPVAVAVPDSLRDHALDGAAVVAVCPRCLTISPAGADPANPPDLSQVSDALPTGEAGVAVLLLVPLLDAIAVNRQSIEALVAAVETAGGDPFLALEGLADDPGVDPAVPIDRRRHQLEQLL